MCETKIQTVCRFETVNNVLIKLILNGKDLYKNYNTFYDEYLNNSFSSDFDKEMLLNYYATIKCITPGDLIENYYYKNPMTTINIKNKLFQNFTYFIDKKNVTISKQPKLAIIYRLYDMRSLLPKIEAAFPLDPSQYTDILTGEINVKFTLSYEIFRNVSGNIDPMSLIVGGRLFYEIDLTDNSGELIRFVHFHSALDMIKNFEVLSNDSKGTIILILVLIGIGFIVSAILFYIYFKKKKGLNSNESLGIEIHQFNPSKK